MERIFENPILLFILIAFVTSMFSKSKRSAENKRPRRLPEITRELKEMVQDATNPEPRGSGRRPVQHHQETHGQAPARAKQSAAAQEEVLVPISTTVPAKKQDSARQIRGKVTAVQEESLTIESLKEKNLADAIVWAEILGPPRSKKPYYKR
ncbi:hypothetical protein [Bacillus sp. FJAT-27445]|uniref:hypothetical protein n=1 Tax=Bacillus sp. FJAT-27445 TaxID=1679166 RepID=UPI000743CA4C|nr:hypothetical protein [Bacillus sp. FJAT-27445]